MAENFGAAGNLIGPGACRQQGKTVTHSGTVPPKAKTQSRPIGSFQFGRTSAPISRMTKPCTGTSSAYNGPANPEASSELDGVGKGV